MARGREGLGWRTSRKDWVQGTESGESDRCNGRIVAFSITENVDRVPYNSVASRLTLHRHLEYHQSTSISLVNKGLIFRSVRHQRQPPAYFFDDIVTNSPPTTSSR
jgi:hypothetical protein